MPDELQLDDDEHNEALKWQCDPKADSSNDSGSSLRQDHKYTSMSFLGINEENSSLK